MGTAPLCDSSCDDHAMAPRCRERAPSTTSIATKCTAANAALFDHLVGAGEQGGRYRETKRPRRLSVDNEFEFFGLHNRQVGGSCTLENASDIDTNLTKCIRHVGPITHKPAVVGIVARRVNGGDRIARR